MWNTGYFKPLGVADLWHLFSARWYPAYHINWKCSSFQTRIEYSEFWQPQIRTQVFGSFKVTQPQNHWNTSTSIHWIHLYKLHLTLSKVATCYCVLEAGIILCMCPANERWRYTVTPSLIGWAHTLNDLCGGNGHLHLLSDRTSLWHKEVNRYTLPCKEYWNSLLFTNPTITNSLSVWNKTKFGSQNFGYQIWYFFCGVYIMLWKICSISI